MPILISDIGRSLFSEGNRQLFDLQIALFCATIRYIRYQSAANIRCDRF
ncbi:MAG: hypothetical protein F6J93_19255 [Oscillatoria sp. SIO1A7]|nr:hypothetical protein [Oscillatoria sp. SIO1A7]